MEQDEFLFGLNIGGSAYTDIAGNLYAADDTGEGRSYSTGAAISGTLDDPLFQSEAWSASGLTYDVAVSAGTYYVELNFAELYFSGSDDREFDVFIEGVQVVDNLDIYEVTGAKNAAYTIGFFVEVLDGSMTLELAPEIQNPKINAFSIWSVVPPDAGNPTVAIAVTGGTTATDPVTVTVTYTDETALDPATVELTDLAISGAGTYTIQSETLTFAPDNTSATATYTVLQDGGWTTDPVSFDVAADAVTDTEANGNAAANAGFTFVPDTTVPTATIAVTGGTTATDPVTVTVTYTDETALDPATVALTDLAISGAGTYTIQSETLTFAPDNTSATATYTVLQDGGWTTDPVSFDVAADAVADTSANGNAAANAGFTFVPDTTVPTAAIVVTGGTGTTDPVTVTVTYTDETALDPATVELTDLAISGAGTYTIQSETLTFAPDNTSATATYTVLQDGGWTTDPVSFDVAADAVADTSANGNVAANAGFTFTPPVDTTGPTASISVTGGTDTTEPVTVTVTYTDETALDPATVALTDLAITGAGTYTIQSETLTFAPDNTSATATYTVLQDGGWTTDPVSFDVAADAVADTSANGNAAANAGFTFGSGPLVNSLADMTQLALQGVSLNNPTSIDVGADGRIYVSEQSGLISALTIEKNTTTNNGVTTETWTVIDREDITLIKDMPNHDDTGIYQPGVQNRQVTGLTLTTTDTGEMMIYVTSSDPRIGGGGDGVDENLDTNSGILSRLTQQPDGSWEKLDLVRGLPRSEENHATNGMVLTTNADGEDVILLTVGGFTNTGAQSNNFAYTPEYYYAASVVEIDLGQLEAMETAGPINSYLGNNYLYDLPTLDDITRTNDVGGGDLAGDGSTTADVFGGNNGLNQAIYDPLEIVKVVYTGFRNHYDIAVTETGEVYTVDNGSNAGWGGITVNAAGEELVDLDGDGIADNGPGLNLPNNGGESNADSLLRIDDDLWTPDTSIYYGGHPNLFRAYGEDAGFYLYADAGNPWGVAAGTPLDFVGGVLTPTTDPVDLAPLIPNIDQISGVDGTGQPIIDPQQAVQLGTGSRTEGLTSTPNGALYTFFSSTNGLDIYTAPGDMQGELVTVSFNGKIYAIDIGPDGTVVDVEERALTSSPLDLVTQGADDPYPGMIFVAAYGADQIVILSPDSGTGVTPDPNDRDQDGIDDTIDPFAADPDNGLLDVITAGSELYWSFVNGEDFPNDRESIFDGTGGLFNGGDIGFTGIMTNRGGLPESLYVQDNIIFGGAPGVLQVKNVDVGDATNDTQRNGFQLGTTVDPGVTYFTVSSLIDNYLDDVGSVPASEKLSQGIFVGAGDQNNFVSVSLVRLADGQTGFEVVSQFAFDFIGETPPQISFYAAPDLATAGALDTVELFLDVNAQNGTVTPRWSYDLSGVETTGAGSAVTLQGDALKALEGTLTLPDNSGGQVATGLAVGMVSSRSGGADGGDPVTIAAISSGGDETFVATIDGVDVTFVPDNQASNVTITGTSKVYGGSESNDIAGTELDELHTEERYAKSGVDWGYDIATGNGTFQVDLYFAEIWGGGFSPGARVFDVLVEDQIVANNLDIYSQVGGNTEYILTVTANVLDGVLDIDFDSEIENAKVNAVLVRDVNTLEGEFAADWDHLRIEGFGTPPVDSTPPTVSISASGGVVGDDPVIVTVTYADEIALDTATVELTDLVITGPGSYTVISETLDIAADNKSATATYFVEQDGGWTTDTVNFDVAAGAVTDISANGNAAATASFTYIDPNADNTVPTVAIAVTGGTTTTDPVTVTVTYTDETELDPATVELTDLAITGAGTYTIQSETLSFAPDNTSATAIYTVLQDGGWTTDPVSFDVAADAIADTSANGNLATNAGFTFTPPDTTVPTAAIVVTGGTTTSEPVTVTVTYTDETALDPATVELTDLAITGAGTYTIQSETLTFAPDNTSATATYTVLQDGGWTVDPVSFDVAADAIADTSANGNLAANAGFTFTPPVDTTGPTAAISVTGGATTSEPVTVTVTYTDETALDPATVALTDLAITGAGTYTIQSETLTFAPDNTSATATYTVLQDGGWTTDPVSFDVAADAVADTSANGNAAANAGFTFVPDTTVPTATIVVTGGTGTTDPVTVTVTYSDDTALDPATVELTDLAISGAGTYTIQSETLTFAPDNTSATATYTVLQDGGWTIDPVSFDVAADAVADTSANGNAAANAGFTFDPDPAGDVFVFALNAGGDAYTDVEGVTYEADNTGVGRSYTNTKAIAGTEDDPLYQSEVWDTGGFTYDIALANGTYRVDLNFAEIYKPFNEPGERVFDVFLEDILVLDDFDIVAETGSRYTAYETSAMVTVNDGSLTLRTEGVVDNPKISAFSIWIDDDMIA